MWISRKKYSSYLLAWEDLCTAAVYDLASGRWLAWASVVVAHCMGLNKTVEAMLEDFCKINYWPWTVYVTACSLLLRKLNFPTRVDLLTIITTACATVPVPWSEKWQKFSDCWNSLQSREVVFQFCFHSDQLFTILSDFPCLKCPNCNVNFH